MRSTFVLIIVGILLVSFTLIQPIRICKASGNTIYVDDSGGANYTTIQSAINAATPGYTIYVYSGTYNENVEINKILTVTGENKESTIINGISSGNVVKITANYVNVSGFTIQNAVGIEMKCIMMDKVQNCKITNNIIKSSNDGIYLFDSDGNTLSGNTIKDNDVNGIFASYSDNNIFENNQIHYNQNGISIGSYSDNNEIFNNDIKGKQESSPQGIGVYMDTSTSGNLVYHNYLNDFDDNAYDSNTGNTWYKSSTHEGNYWDDYDGVDENPKNGIGDTPYNITTDGSVQDIYPLGYFKDGNQKPIATIDSISPTTIKYGETVYFSGQGTDPDPEDYISSYNWRSDRDGQLSTQHSFSKSTLSIGTHTIYFKVIDNHGAESTEKTAQITVTQAANQKPIAEIVTISPNPATYGDPVYFHGIGHDGVVTGYSWRSSRDGSLSGEQTFTKSDLSIGTHIIYFKVRNNMGEWSNEVPESLDIISSSSPSNEPPNADAGGPYLGYVNATISFDGSKSTDDGTIVSYKWDFGDEITAIGISITHAYTMTGNYTVTLTVTDNGGKTDTGTTYANVSIQPTGNNGEKTPGFGILFVFIAAAFILLWKRKI